ncbi:MAG TPA: PAS domain-containing protein [Victivallales bacterium]|nr:PAS domain-containing protein [Victivallales bacterium]
MSEGIAIMDDETKNYIYINKTREILYGYPKEVFFDKGINFRINNCIHPEDRAREKEYYTSGKWPDYDEFRIFKPDGEIRWLSSTYTHTVFMGKKCTMSVQRDITDFKQQQVLNKKLEKNIQVATTTGVREGLKKAVILLKNEGIDNKIISKVLELN